MEKKIAKAVGLSNVGIYGWFIWYCIKALDIRAAVMILLLNATVTTLKKMVENPRPKGACGCDAFGIAGPATTFGMPSGHVATAVFGWMVIAKHYFKTDSATKVAAVIAGLLMSWARVTVGCHSVSQSLFGALLGYAWYQIYSKFL